MSQPLKAPMSPVRGTYGDNGHLSGRFDPIVDQPGVYVNALEEAAHLLAEAEVIKLSDRAAYLRLRRAGLLAQARAFGEGSPT